MVMNEFDFGMANDAVPCREALAQRLADVGQEGLIGPEGRLRMLDANLSSISLGSSWHR